MTNRQICAMEDRWTSRAFHSIGLYILTNAILQIDNRLQRIWGKDLTAIMQSARTATTAAECAGRIGTYKYAESLGIQLKQMWRATLDGKTRHAHRLLDSQVVDIGQPFEVDGYELKYPGDPSAPGYLVYNCRCTVVSVDKFHDPNAPRAAKLGDMSYEEWKAGKEVNATNKWGIYSGNAQNSVDNSPQNGIISLRKSGNRMLNSKADPMADVFGAGEISNPEEVKAFRKEIKEYGVELVEREKESLAYSPGLSPGKPGTIYVSKNASYSAWLHEIQHMRDDKDAGWVGMRIMCDPDKRYAMEVAAYDCEIELALAANRPDIADILRNNLEEERRIIYGESVD